MSWNRSPGGGNSHEITGLPGRRQQSHVASHVLLGLPRALAHVPPAPQSRAPSPPKTGVNVHQQEGQLSPGMFGEMRDGLSGGRGTHMCALGPCVPSILCAPRRVRPPLRAPEPFCGGEEGAEGLRKYCTWVIRVRIIPGSVVKL